jgi:hypothetical protein
MMLVMTLSTAFNIIRCVIELPATALAPVIWFLKKTWDIDFIFLKADETVLDHVTRARDEIRAQLNEPDTVAAFDAAYRAELNSTKYKSKKTAHVAGRRAGVKALALHFDYAPRISAPDVWWVPKCLRRVVQPVSPACLRRVVGPESAVAKAIGAQVKKAMQELKDTAMMAGMLKKYYTRCHWAKYVPGVPTAIKLVIKYALGLSLDKLIAELVTDTIDQITGIDGEHEDHAPAWYKGLGASARPGTNEKGTEDSAEMLEIEPDWIEPSQIEAVEVETVEVQSSHSARQCNICGGWDEDEDEDEDQSFTGCGTGRSAFSVEV